MNKQVINKFSTQLIFLFTFIVIFSFTSCSNSSKESANSSSEEIVVGTTNDIGNENFDEIDEEQTNSQEDEQYIAKSKESRPSHKIGGAGTTANPVQTGAAPSETDIDEYEISITMEKKVYMNQTSNLSVLIGAKGKYDLKQEKKSEIRDKTDVMGDIDIGGMYAKVVLNANDFEIISSDDEYKCLKVYPYGTPFGFVLKPKKEGTFEIKANVYFYKDCNCVERAERGKISSNTLKIKVVVDEMTGVRGTIMNHVAEFITALVVLILGAILFVVRKFIKNKTGFEVPQVDATVDKIKTIISKDKTVNTDEAVKTVKAPKVVEIDEEVEVDEIVESDENNDEK
ncbi:hypothetical protein LJC30_00740 [Odoribacter sp. OttesenSCG-928-L07]|nr:hypothetical protein [Odoribacter sp. OttesenSCG-928-L07]MDL2238718.1 hypothetical protein [Bacteroidales bacterium OttesenSCG-928-L14]